MRRTASFLITLAGCGLLMACAQDVQFTASKKICGFKRHELAARFPQEETEGQPVSLVESETGSGISYDARLADAMTSATARAPGKRPTMLFLSGGGQHGSYGAGFMDEWAHQRAGGLPKFSVVTGISTGAILASFAFTGITQNAVDGYTIANERELLTPFITPAKNGGLGLKAGITLAQKGAVADLTMLKTHLAKHITHDVLVAVAKGDAEGRGLFVGAVDVDTGEAVAFDLGNMAKRYVRAFNGEAQGRPAQDWKDCYIDAILASSSAPIAAQPVFIDNRQYIDGGARFGLFDGKIGALIRNRARLVSAASGPKPQIPISFAIVNGYLTIGNTAGCPWEDQTVCKDGQQPTGLVQSPHKPWNFLSLAMRSTDVLENQVYRFSAERLEVKDPACPQGSCLRIVRIEPEALAHKVTLDGREQTCQQWKDDDRRVLNPVQFFPHYMRCMIDYGRARARQENWAAVE